MDIAISRRFIIWGLIILLLFSLIFALPSSYASTPKTLYTVVIDAGHGGVDGGAVGRTTGKEENSLNLEYANCLKNLLEAFSMEVVMTRTNLNGLYGAFSTNKKRDDMQRRKDIIQKSGADLVISIHMNSHSLSSYKGAQVFYKKTDENGMRLANNIQALFLQTLPNARKTASPGDYYILNCSSIPSVIVECGYLSNPQDEQNLLTTTYKDSLCTSIFIGIVKYLSL